jgi:hypothetical protein
MMMEMDSIAHYGRERYPMPPSFIPAAHILWDAIPPHFQERVLHNVWCPHCGDMTTMTDFTGAVHGKSLVLRGTCVTCRGSAARRAAVLAGASSAGAIPRRSIYQSL